MESSKTPKEKIVKTILPYLEMIAYLGAISQSIKEWFF